jgi:pyridinium-3,5-biscarboxylic acid mononucleotide sulfurtransferase
MDENSVKLNNLISYLSSFGRVAVAFSGGVDSSLLLMAAKMALKDQVEAITIRTPYIPAWEIEEAVVFCREHSIRHKLFEVSFLHQLKDNPKDRCYWCKSYLFKSILYEAKKEGYNTVMDGTNFDDLRDYRPGLQALKELQIISPFLEMKITKEEIRRFSRQLNLPTWEKPAYACLLTRIPYGQEITKGDLKRIEQAERYLRREGFVGSRVRIHGNLVRIELLKDDMARMNVKMMDAVHTEMKAIGFTYITLDMEGYRTGSHNESL